MYRIEPSIDNLELSHGLITEEILEYTSSQLDYFLSLVCNQQLGVKNNIEFIIEHGDDVLPYIVCIICKDNSFSVTMEESKSIISLNPGDLLIFPSEMSHGISNPDNAVIKKLFYRQKIDNSIGYKNFIITSTLIDKYEITISANSEEEALEKAKATPISSWNHLDLYPDVEDRKIIRYAKWNNFSAKAID